MVSSNVRDQNILRENALTANRNSPSLTLSPPPRPARDHNTQLFILFIPFVLESPFNSTVTAIILNCRFYRYEWDFVDKNKNIVYCIVCFIIRKCTTCLMANIEAETCTCKTSYVETPLSNIINNSCVWLHFTDTCVPHGVSGGAVILAVTCSVSLELRVYVWWREYR